MNFIFSYLRFILRQKIRRGIHEEKNGYFPRLSIYFILKELLQNEADFSLIDKNEIIRQAIYGHFSNRRVVGT